MLSTKTSRLALLAVVAVAIVATPASAQQGCVPVKGTIVGHLRLFDPNNVPDFLNGLPPGVFENTEWDGNGGWYGWAYLQFGKADPVSLLLVDHGIPGTSKPLKEGSDSFRGDEILTFKLPGAGSFQMRGSFVALAGQAPHLFAFNETGRITGGEGRYAGANGHIAINGLFTLGPSETFIDAAHDPFLWIAQVNGLYCGAR